MRAFLLVSSLLSASYLYLPPLFYSQTGVHLFVFLPCANVSDKLLSELADMNNNDRPGLSLSEILVFFSGTADLSVSSRCELVKVFQLSFSRCRVLSRHELLPKHKFHSPLIGIICLLCLGFVCNASTRQQRGFFVLVVLNIT